MLSKINNKKTITAIITSALLIIVGSLVINTVITDLREKNEKKQEELEEIIGIDVLGLTFEMDNLTILIPPNENLTSETDPLDLWNTINVSYGINFNNTHVLMDVFIDQEYIVIISYDLVSVSLNTTLEYQFESLIYIKELHRLSFLFSFDLNNLRRNSNVKK